MFVSDCDTGNKCSRCSRNVEEDQEVVAVGKGNRVSLRAVRCGIID